MAPVLAMATFPQQSYSVMCALVGSMSTSRYVVSACVGLVVEADQGVVIVVAVLAMAIYLLLRWPWLHVILAGDSR